MCMLHIMSCTQWLLHSHWVLAWACEVSSAYLQQRIRFRGPIWERRSLRERMETTTSISHVKTQSSKNGAECNTFWSRETVSGGCQLWEECPESCQHRPSQSGWKNCMFRHYGIYRQRTSRWLPSSLIWRILKSDWCNRWWRHMNGRFRSWGGVMSQARQWVGETQSMINVESAISYIQASQTEMKTPRGLTVTGVCSRITAS